MEDWSKFLKSISGDIRRLDYIDRFSSIPVTLKENVSAHSFWVATYSLLLHRHLGGNRDLDGMILKSALFHDLGECLTGDVVRTFKYSSGKFKESVDEAEAEMVKKLPENILALYGECIPDKYSSWVIKAADFLSLYEYMNREKLRGNSEISPFIQRMNNEFLSQSEKFWEFSKTHKTWTDHDRFLIRTAESMRILYNQMINFWGAEFTT